ncbi:hypothetical protein LT697_00590 [Pseudomonas syringae pv. syringae]|uniref:hypothetical protein n=1 Tax=Pseudomonas syringae TaxID=317 RepID=UPI002009ED36|nr:hypothetical protein [Pseudomonas syringae]MCK9740041.1 hypothetical protein [Pseudomonas syringae pv. syringae]
MSELICFKTMTRCQTPGMCSPHGGCRPNNESKHLDLGKFIDWIWALKNERDQLKAENAGLKTGYEAYERVNAELRAECEALRNRQSFSDAFYEVSGLLGVTGARPEAPLVVFRQEVVPALQAVIRNSRRYEWLRDSAGSADWEFFGHQQKDSTDQNIDAAMSKEAAQ